MLSSLNKQFELEFNKVKVVKKVRITVKHNPDDPGANLRIAKQIRRDLWANSEAVVNPQEKANQTHRDPEQNAYFEFATDYPDELQGILSKYAKLGNVSMSIDSEETGPACMNCDFVAGPILPTVCPSCGFREITPCPMCDQEIPKQSYLSIVGDLFQCPHCGNSVRFRFKDLMIDEKGYYSLPPVIIDPAEAIHQ
jgi:hypothetical protein